VSGPSVYDNPTGYTFFAALDAAGKADRDVVYRGDPSGVFPASELGGARPAADGRPAELVVAIWRQLYGFQRVLPDHYTDLVQEEAARGTTPLRDFLDLFQHRYFWLYGEARDAAAFPAAATAEGPDRVAALVLDLLGVTPPTAALGRTLVYHAGLFALRPRPRTGLEQLLRSHFRAAVRVDDGPGRWVSLTTAEAAVAGSAAVFDPHGCFRVRLGPMPWRLFREFHPKTGNAFRSLVWLTRLYAGDRDFDVELWPESAEQLTGDLDWATWFSPAPGGRVKPVRISAETCRAALPCGEWTTDSP
jgi:type VI secretion system ImpH/TssG family protein